MFSVIIQTEFFVWTASNVVSKRRTPEVDFLKGCTQQAVSISPYRAAIKTERWHALSQSFSQAAVTLLLKINTCKVQFDRLCLTLSSFGARGLPAQNWTLPQQYAIGICEFRTLGRFSKSEINIGTDRIHISNTAPHLHVIPKFHSSIEIAFRTKSCLCVIWF